MAITARELEALVERLLSEGVPPGVVSRSLDLDPDVVKSAMKGIRITRYGTDDLSDYTEQMQWRVIEEAMTALSTGSAAEKARVMSTVLGKQMAAASKRAPEGQRDKLAQLEEMFAGMRGDDGPT